MKGEVAKHVKKAHAKAFKTIKSAGTKRREKTKRKKNVSHPPSKYTEAIFPFFCFWFGFGGPWFLWFWRFLVVFAVLVTPEALSCFYCLWAEGCSRYHSHLWLGSEHLLFSAPRCFGVIALVSECDESFASTPSASNLFATAAADHRCGQLLLCVPC